MNKEQRALDRRNKHTLIIAVLMMALLLLKPHFYRGYFPTPEDQEWSLGVAPNLTRKYSQCDATQDTLFFSNHSGTISQVYAYGHDGAFQYCLAFRDISNGRMLIRCQEGNLYLKLRNNNVFVFQGSNMIAGLTEDQADAQGFTNDWFRSGASTLVLHEGALYYQDDQQNLVPVTVPAQIQLPQEYAFVDSETGGIIVLICAATVIGFIAYIASKKE